MPQCNREHIARQWRRLIDGKTLDSSVVRPEIYNSWQQCRRQGIDPCGTIKISADRQKVLERSTELIGAARPFMLMINEVIAGSGLRIDCIDHEGYFLCSCGDPTLLRESEGNGFVVGCNIALKTLGTNAAGLCLSLQRPVQVLGPEHYNVHLHNLNCSATPICTPDNQLLGVLNILSYATPQNRQTLGLTTSIAMAIENQLALTRTVDSLRISNAEFNAIIEYLPQGVIATSRSGTVSAYNKKALEMLAIPQKMNEKQRSRQLGKILDTIDLPQNGEQHQERECTISLGSKKRSFVINTHPLKEGEKTLITLEDTRRILNLSAVPTHRTSYTFADIKGESPGILRARELAATVAGTDFNVLLIGESGTGKELFAQAIHAASKRASSPFVAINCGAMPADIIESELFGYEPGAFTGAREAGKPGRLETAGNGSLFLDEVEAMPLNFQVKLLRAFSSQSMVRVGGINEIPLDIRIIAASKVDLLEEVNQGRFREDLYYRIAVFPITIPPLNKRGDDMFLLTRLFLQQLATNYNRPPFQADDTFFAALAAYPWRGNIRELRNAVERAVVMGLDGQQLTAEHLPQAVQTAWMSVKLRRRTKKILAERSVNGSGKDLLKTAEQSIITMVLEEEQGNISRSARRLGIARSTLYTKISSIPQLADVLKSDK